MEKSLVVRRSPRTLKILEVGLMYTDGVVLLYTVLVNYSRS